MFARYVWIIAPLFAAGCGGINILPEPFTRERADGKIPVKVELIRKQVRAELDGMPEGEAEVLRWQAIEKDYNECRLSSARMQANIGSRGSFRRLYVAAGLCLYVAD